MDNRTTGTSWEGRVGGFLLTSVLLLAGAQGASAQTIAAWSQALPLAQQSIDVAALGAGGVSIETILVASGLNDPVKVTHAGDGTNRLFVVEQEGLIKIIDNGTVLPTPFLDVDTRVSCCFEQGLLGLAFSPNYDVDGFFYVNYTDNSGDTVISRFTVSVNNPNRAMPNTEVILKTIDQPFSNHNGGDLAFGPDGMLYAGIGDGGDASDPGNRAQNLLVLLGKMLRLDVDNPPSYIPADNPFVGDPNALDEIWSYGLRNPWRFSFDRATNDILIGDVGQSTREEVSFQPMTSSGGENWGWKVLEGTFCHSNNPPGACNDFLNGDSVLPILEYDHSGGRCSITGGYRYRGAAYPDLDGVYFYADYCTGEIFAGTEDAPGVWSDQEVLDTSFNISSFGEDEAGELYVVNLNGSVYQIASTAGGGIPCADIAQFQARCTAPGGTNRIQVRAVFTDTSHSGETITIGVDGSPNLVTIIGNRAPLQISGAASGAHTVSLDDPAGCFANVVVNCP